MPSAEGLTGLVGNAPVFHDTANASGTYYAISSKHRQAGSLRKTNINWSVRRNLLSFAPSILSQESKFFIFLALTYIESGKQVFSLSWARGGYQVWRMRRVVWPYGPLPYLSAL
jgi:hypothetical protein